jgi:hypothetical protein
MFSILIEAIKIWTRYIRFAEIHAEQLAKTTDLGAEQFLDLCYKKAIAATQYHIPEVH